ncbi:MAG: hypothetical protein H5T69_17540, partial [Chloroflexi bacterium]|nr:hypothetical protein [Chloroflexota bacterium]
HPAFNKLFIESEWLPKKKTQLLRRRKRSEDEQPVLVAHTLYVPEGENYRLLNVEHEGSRANFLGRGNTLRNPQALSAADAKLSGSVGATLDPILAIGQELELGPHASCILYYLTCAGSSREMLLHCVDGHCNVQVLEGILHEGEMRSRDELAALNLEAADLARYQQLLSALLYPHRRLRAPEKVLRANRRGQQRLWPYAISGDYPILLVRIERQEDAALLRDVLRAHAYWRQRGLLIDLVILNEKEAGYAGELDALIRRLVARSNGESRLNRRGGIYILHAYQMDDQDRMLLLSAARVLLDAAEGTLEAQLRREWGYEVPLPDLVATRAPDADPPTEPIPRPAHLEFDNGYGGFRPDGAEYWIYLEPGQKTPAPWCNVVANAEFGFLISEQGSSFTWAGNSGENRLTPWNNDPVSDEPGEVLYLRDEETTEVWSPTPLPARESSAYLIRHGIGYTIFAHRSHGLEQEVRLYVAPQDPVKLVALRVRNIWNRPRRVTATYYAEWVLGVIRHDTQQYVLPDFDADVQVLLATNPYNEEFGQRTAFLTSSEPIHGLTTDRSEFLGRYGSKQAPAALRRIGLASCLEAGRDPCAALQIHLDIPANGEREVYFVLGQGTDRESAVELARLYREPERAAQAWEEMRRQWDQILGVVQVDTPDEAMNMLLNRWSLYQALSCRLWGRSAFYQSSGAFGFRDQLQDVMALLHSRPELAREHLLRAAAHQFEAGDVLHWWHPPSGRGVRTRISDDLLWLPFCTAEYVQVTGDEAILREEVPFLRGDPLKEGEEERYGLWQT